MRKFEREQGQDSIPVIVIIGSSRDGIRDRVFAAEFQQYITKPILPDKVIASVAHLTGRAEINEKS
ncbi:MAG: response regulator [Phormidium tanganyikae FI6-MK23]|jgi:CheY-like chemotaxis protein|nr:response regulator [Phormidium tanganyikae FI6-MK23]